MSRQHAHNAYAGRKNLAPSCAQDIYPFARLRRNLLEVPGLCDGLACCILRYVKDLAVGHQKAMDRLAHEQAQVDDYIKQRHLDTVRSSQISALSNWRRSMASRMLLLTGLRAFA